MWAEAFGRWASDMSTQDAAMLKGVLPAAVQKPQATEWPSLALPPNGDLLGLLKVLGAHHLAIESKVKNTPAGEATDELLAAPANTPLEYGAKWLGERTEIGRDHWREVGIRLASGVDFGPWNSHTQSKFPDIQHLAPKIEAINQTGITPQLKIDLAKKWPALGTGITTGDGNASAKAKRRGRPSDTDPQADAKIAEAWDTGHYQTYERLGQETGMSGRDVELAIDRHRKRQRRQKPSE
jgi:hypothetical protein